MAISYVGGQEGGRAGSTSTSSTNYALTGGSDSTPLEGDLVVIVVACGTQARTPACAVTAPGTWTNLTQQNVTSTTQDTSVNVSYKFMGSTPDTAFTLPSTGNNQDGQAYAVQVFRGVDRTTPLDVSVQTATGTATTRANPPSITPTTAGAWPVCLAGGGAAATTDLTFADLSNVQSGLGPDTNDAVAAMGYKSNWTSGAFDCAASSTGSANAADSWAAYSIVLRPAALVETLTENFSSAIDSGKWTSFGTNGTETAVSGVLELDITTAAAANSAQIHSVGTFNLIGSSVFVKLVQPMRVTGDAGGVYTTFGLEQVQTPSNSGDDLLWYVNSNGTMAIDKHTNGTGSTLDTITSTYFADAATYRWLRISESGGTVSFHTASDSAANNPPSGGDWTEQHTVALSTLPSQFTNCKVMLYVYMDVSNTKTQVAKFDGLNTAATIPAHTTTGDLVGQGSTIVGSAHHKKIHTDTGALVGPGSTIVGSAARTRVHATSGALVGQGATVVGSAHHKRIHTDTGALVGQGSTIAGAATRFRAHPTTGVLTGAGAVVDGAASSKTTRTSSGALVGPGALVVGSASRSGGPHATSGALVGPGAAISGSAHHKKIHTSTSALVGPGASIAGSAARTHVHPATGVLTGQGSALSGSAVHTGWVSSTYVDWVEIHRKPVTTAGPTAGNAPEPTAPSQPGGLSTFTTAQLNAILDANLTCSIADGIYTITAAINIRDNHVISATNARQVVFKVDAAYNNAIISEVNTDFSLSGIILDGNYVNRTAREGVTAASLVEVQGCSVTFDNCVFQNAPSYGIWSYNAPTAPQITNNEFYECWHAIRIDGNNVSGAGGLIEDNKFLNTTALKSIQHVECINTDDLVIRGNATKGAGFLEPTTHGFEGTWGNSFYIWNSDGPLCEENTCYENYWSPLVYGEDCTNGTVRRNYFLEGNFSNAHHAAWFEQSGNDNHVIDRNYFDGAVLLGDLGGNHITFTNNIIRSDVVGLDVSGFCVVARIEGNDIRSKNGSPSNNGILLWDKTASSGNDIKIFNNNIQGFTRAVDISTPGNNDEVFGIQTYGNTYSGNTTNGVHFEGTVFQTIALAVTQTQQRVQAESGSLDGTLTVGTVIASYAGSGYVGAFNDVSDELEINFTTVEAGRYLARVRYANNENTQNRLEIEGVETIHSFTDSNKAWTDYDSSQFDLPGGTVPFSVLARLNTHAVTGTLVGQGSVLTGSAHHKKIHTTSGVLVGQGSSLAGSASSATSRPSSGVLVGPGATLAGSAHRTRVHATTGVLTGQGSAIVGSAHHKRIHATSGALVGPGAALAGSSFHGGGTHFTTGVLVGPGAVLVGSSHHKKIHTTTGALVGPGAAIAGSANRFRAHATTGSLTGQGSSVSGTARRFRTHFTTGALTGSGSSVVGLARRDHFHVTTGVLVGPGAVISGTAPHGGPFHMCSGALVGQGSTITAIIIRPTLGAAGLRPNSPDEQRSNLQAGARPANVQTKVRKNI